MTVLILLMVSGVVAEGIPSAVAAYVKAIDAANAQVLISTTVNALRGELSTAKEVHLNDENGLIYISPATGSKTKLYIGYDVGDTHNTIMVQDFLRYDETGPQTTDGTTHVAPRRLVSKSAKTANLEVTYDKDTVSCDNDVIHIKNLKVTKGDTGSAIVEIADLYIRCLGVSKA